MHPTRRLLCALALPVALAACAQAPLGTAIPDGGVAVTSVAASVPAHQLPDALFPALRTVPHATHPYVAYEPLHGCTTWNTAYAMHEMAGKYECAALYTPGRLQAYRFVVFRDAYGNAYTTARDGRWTRNPDYDGYVAGDQPHR